MADIGHFGKITFSYVWSNLSDFDDLGVYFDVFYDGQFIKAHVKSKRLMHHAKNPIWPTSPILKIAFSHEWSNLSDFDDLGVYFDYFVHDKLQKHIWKPTN